ncbi:ATP synthase F0, A subunit [Thermoanaerobacter mathranii subsp. mathranii str. A3]|uniref:ATP synthase subunit a n=1 Tax=Thermoanaerobacter mathranii subsp. mathranii (strain DSM 11426 / CCUG 53645 / CIP 108742 / A3) TaxID=583358 RepID=A0ABM5LNW1_THEM3|nr:F0F1 ATP synthase subunit A [Thermoanaerobacter mathranii]ADH60438.1 ATP synthase F0, A subunit [Thermoanaerobacter mathranii subsp. mathranii str. A3]MBT1279291.1 F0F1 ATP synthase subunit A [Thermoanaerobacter sp. CM-CNRG TB177]
MQIQSPVVFTIPLFGGIPVTMTVVVEWIIMAVLIVATSAVTKGWKLVPEGTQNMVELIIEGFNKFVKNSLGDYWKDYTPYLGTVAAFLILANTISIFGLAPPTKDISATSALALMSIVTVVIASIRARGVKGYAKYFFKSPINFFINVLDLFTRPLSLAARLFGNIFAAVTIMGLIERAVPIVLPAVFSIYFDLFDGLLQMLVFVFLTMLYIQEAIEE